jgi:predicted Zn-dependent protease
MLFDLQSRRRRTAVKFIYALLAVLMAGGLVLFGIGAGNGNGGIASSLVGNGSSGNSTENATINKAIKVAQAKITADPKSAGAWNALIQARYEQANSAADFNSTTETYTAGGKTALKEMLSAYIKYAALVKGPESVTTAFQAAHAYAQTGEYADATGAWQAFLQAEPGNLRGFECLAYTGYAAKDTTLADEAAAKAVAQTPKLDQLTVKTDFKDAKSSKATAEDAALAEC